MATGTNGHALVPSPLRFTRRETALGKAQHHETRANTLTDVIVDAGESAKTLDLPGMVRVQELVKARQVEAVIVLKLDRLTRNVRDLADLLDTFRSRKVALMSVSESLNTETAAGRMVVNLLGVVGQWEREAIARLTCPAIFGPAEA